MALALATYSRPSVRPTASLESVNMEFATNARPASVGS